MIASGRINSQLSLSCEKAIASVDPGSTSAQLLILIGGTSLRPPLRLSVHSTGWPPSNIKRIVSSPLADQKGTSLNICMHSNWSLLGSLLLSCIYFQNNQILINGLKCWYYCLKSVSYSKLLENSKESMETRDLFQVFFQYFKDIP